MKKKVCWTLENDCIELLKQSKKLNINPKTTLTGLVEYAIRNTYKNKKEYYREKMKHHQQKLIEYKDKLEDLDNNTNESSRRTEL